jgi:hypothetical protein
MEAVVVAVVVPRSLVSGVAARGDEESDVQFQWFDCYCHSHIPPLDVATVVTAEVKTTCAMVVVVVVEMIPR